jgi:uracil-DNA glycosylase
VGLAFSVGPDVRPLPGSLRNIFIELVADLGVTRPESGDLSVWANHGVLLLNRTLTVAPGEPLSHRGLGWSTVTDSALATLMSRPVPLVVLAWGREAQSALSPFATGENVTIIESAHPSPLSASRGFLGSRPFSRANDALIELGAEAVDWSVDSK